MGIIDNGCPENVAGEQWLKLYKQSLEKDNLQTRPSSERFKFGPSDVFIARKQVRIPIEIGELKSNLDVYIVNCEIPLLISNATLRKWEVKQDILKKKLHKFNSR